MRLGWAIRACELGLRFVRWWSNELALSVPSEIRRQVFRQGERFLARAQDDGIAIRRVEGPDGSWRPLNDQEPNLDPKIGSAALVLAQQVVLRRLIELPYAAITVLQEATSFQVARITPFASRDACHVARVLSRDRKKKVIRVEVAVVPRALLGHLLAQVEAAGIRPSAILVDGDVSKPLFNFLPGLGYGAKQSGNRQWQAAMAAAVVLVLVTPFVAAYRIHVAARAAAAEVVNAAKVARKASTAQSQLDAAIISRSFLPDRLRGPRAIEVLDAFSRFVPDTAWLFRVEIRPQEATISGFSSDLPALLQQLAAAPFSEPELTSPVMQGRSGGQTRFDIRVRYRGSS